MRTVAPERCVVADTAGSRMRGLLGRPPLEPGEGLLLVPCRAVHTFFMRYPIDVVFLDRELRVLRVCSRVRPWRLRACRRAQAVLELPAGSFSGQP